MSDTPLFGPDDRVDDIEALLRELDASDFELTAPPVEVWAGIEAAIREDDSLGDPRRDRVVPLTSRAHRTRTMMFAAAAAVVMIAVGAVVFVSIRGTDDAVVASATLVHEADFDPLGADSAATARLVETGGSYRIELADAALPDTETDDLELWLISTTADGEIDDIQPVSLVDPDAPGTYAVPAGLDPDVYSIVDISIEPRDGDEAHSGRSILRGTLTDV